MRVLIQKNWKTARLNKLKLAIVGFGDVGQRLAIQVNDTFKGRMSVLAVGRQARVANETRFLYADLDNKLSLKRLAALPKRVVYLAPPPNTGLDDARMRRFLAVARCVEHCVYVSTTGVYGAAGGAWVKETTPLRATEPRSVRRIAAENWLRASTLPCVNILRAPGIYAADRLPIARIQAKLPTFIAADDVPTNHIHADDLARLCWLAFFKARNRRAYNAADGQAMMHAEYLTQVANTFGLPPPPRLPAAQVKAALSPIAWSMLAGARRVSSERLLTEWGVRLKYPSVSSFLAQAEQSTVLPVAAPAL